MTTINNPSITSDRDYLVSVTRKMLARLENALDIIADEKTNADKLTLYKTSHELLFGMKSSLAEALVSLAELMMTMEVEKQTTEPAEQAEQKLSAADMALIEAFMQRRKNAPPMTGDLFS